MGQGHLYFAGIKVHADNAAPGGVQQLDGKLAQQPKPNNGHRETQGDIGHAHRFQGNAAQGDKGTRIETDSCWQLDAEIGRHQRHLGMACIAGSATGNAIARGKSFHAFAHIQNHPGRRITGQDGRVQTAHRLPPGLHDPLRLSFGKHTPDQVRARQRLVDQILLSKLDQLFFGSYTDQRSAGSNQNRARLHVGGGRIFELHFSRFIALKDLFHSSLVLIRCISNR